MALGEKWPRLKNSCSQEVTDALLLWIQVRKNNHHGSSLCRSNFKLNLNSDLKQHSHAYFGLLLVGGIGRFNLWSKRKEKYVSTIEHWANKTGKLWLYRVDANICQTWLRIRSDLRLCRWRHRHRWWRSRSHSTPPPPPRPQRQSALGPLTVPCDPHCHHRPPSINQSLILNCCSEFFYETLLW